MSGQVEVVIRHPRPEGMPGVMSRSVFLCRSSISLGPATLSSVLTTVVPRRHSPAFALRMLDNVCGSGSSHIPRSPAGDPGCRRLTGEKSVSPREGDVNQENACLSAAWSATRGKMKTGCRRATALFSRKPSIAFPIQVGKRSFSFRLMYGGRGIIPLFSGANRSTESLKVI